MILYFRSSCFCAQPVLGLFLEQSFEQISQLVAHENRNIRISELNFIEELLATLGVEWGQSHNHLIND